jgi:pantoate--beta-alanine ligase
MIVARTFMELQQAIAGLRAAGKTLALIPTMGALHEGHLALLRAGASHADCAAASIFVNPLQFAANEDLARYPRDEAGDLAKLAQAGCGLVWLPSVETMYPPDDATTVDVGGPAQGWEGAARPGHFRGVATIVAKLLGQVNPDIAVFGEKDWQQLQVIRRMVRDLGYAPRILGVPVVREADGLAMSSRNRFLPPAARAIAPVLYRTLTQVRRGLHASPPAQDALRNARDTLTEAGFAVDYLALVAGQTLRELHLPLPGSRLIAAARLGDVRLLDNIAAD